MHPIDIRKYKIELREQCRNRRKNLNVEQKNEMDCSIAENVRRLYQYRSAKVIMVYVSTSIEVDTFKIIENALMDGKQVAVPRCIPQTRQMEFHYITSVEQLAPGSFSVLEPPEHYPIVSDFTGALMLVPGFMFDCFGFRLGYGKGYYDRYLSRYNGAAVGLCYSEELRAHMHHGRYDRAVDAVVSEKWIRRCKKYISRKRGAFR
ncbi:MAG: 5-formyltetrahydrofolate cyclo-ligase [Ruminococcaceae bacterium]|nr:5-formyltetrahydrofolate cyclo-ligase [Oscillospiraceae bacterium]